MSVAKDSTSKLTISLVVMVIMFYLFAMNQPYSNRHHNKLDVRLTGCCIAVLVAGMIFTNESVDSKFRRVVELCLAAIMASIALLVLRELWYTGVTLHRSHRARLEHAQKHAQKVLHKNTTQARAGAS